MDKSAVACFDFFGSIEEANVSRVVEIRDRTDTPCSVTPKPNDFEIVIDMFQHFCADDRIILVRIRPAVEGVAHKEQLWPLGASAGVADRLGAEVETAVSDVAFLQDHCRQKAAPAPDFKD